MTRPFLLVLAGPNGSGKSTLTDYLIKHDTDFGQYINPDEIAATITEPEPQRSKRAQEIADSRRDRCLKERISFSFETVMSHESKIDLMARAADVGYDITLFFICTSDPKINLRRVRMRVAMGGHDVPPDRIIARYRRSLDLLCRATLFARRSVLFDNSAEVTYRNPPRPELQKGLRPVCEVIRTEKDYAITIGSGTPAWVFRYLLHPLAALARNPDSGIKVTIEGKTGTLG